MHPAIERAEQATPVEMPVFGNLSKALCPRDLSAPEARTATSDRHADPRLGGRWLAGYAPVGNTGFVVIVQTPYE
jgi:hypothetical protein